MNIQPEHQEAVDLLAARQMFPAHHIHKDHPKITPSCMWSEDPFPLLEPPRHEAWMIGIKRGRCEVMGFFGSIEGRSYWSVKCLCGGYELLRGKTLRKPERGEHMCARCRTEFHLKQIRAPGWEDRRKPKQP